MRLFSDLVNEKPCLFYYRNMYNFNFPTCKIFRDPRFPPATLVSRICPHYGLHTLLETNPLPRLTGGVIPIVGGVMVGVGVAVVAQVLAAIY